MEIVSYAWWAFFFRWLHIIGGIMWIGLLWYFNFVQTPTMPKVPEELRPAVTRFIAPEALFWFRWGAVWTVVSGLILAGYQHEFVSGLSLGIGAHSRRITAIGFGMWLGLIMFFNVWVLIWPNQRKVLGIVAAEADERRRAGRIAGLASRTNTMLSIPLLYMMASNHYL